MSVVSTVSEGSSIPIMNSHRILSKRAFDELFYDAKHIGTDETAYSEDRSITSFSIGDCITLFAIEKKDGKIQAIMGWHFSDETTVEDMKGDDFLNAFVFGKELDDDEESSEPHDTGKKYDLYIIGGNAATTQGTGCLLANIHQAIEEFFFEGSYVIRLELTDLNAKTTYNFVSANLQMDGTLTICHHQNRHY